MNRLVTAELRKLVDTRTGLVLVATGALLAGLFGGGAVLYRPGAPFSEVTQLAGVPGGILATIMAILLVTAERSHRTALVTYTLTPRRGRVALAKAAAAATLGVVVVGLALLAALVIVPVGSAVTGAPANWSIEAPALGWWALGTVVGALSGYALGSAVGNAPAAITLVLIWPMAASLLGQVPGADAVLAWLDPAALSTLADGVTGVEIGQAVSGIAVWVAIPAAIGLVRLVRTEVR